MSSGLVYMRPTPVFFVRCQEDEGVDGRLGCWHTLFQWLENQSANDENVLRLFGLHWPQGPKGSTKAIPAFDACAELATLPEPDSQMSVRKQTLPGGGFLRERFRSDAEDHAIDALAELACRGPQKHGVRQDRTRPLIELHLQWTNAPLNFSKTELLVPVSP
ncbi:MAG: hypothetical protein AAF732_17270 [Pseudomonadota bacterium]